jgi:acyl-CoA synthetase
MTIRADEELVGAYRAAGWWGTETLADRVAAHAAGRPDAVAYETGERTMTWHRYDRRSTELAAILAGTGLDPGDRVAVLLPDGPTVHATFLAAEKAGLVVVGIGHRAGDREMRHLLGLTGAQALITHPTHRDRPASELRAALAEDGRTLAHHLVVPDLADADPGPVLVDGAETAPPGAGVLGGRRLGPDDLCILNSTSGTTGLPKCVMHTENRWFYFHQLAVVSGRFGDDEVFMSVIPAPFGFGLWTAHFTPGILGCPTIVMERFEPGAALDLIERFRVTVLCCVSTQFIMLLNAQAEQPRDLSSLRSMYTGGEAVPYERAAEFEDTTGAKVLQFYGSNETGALSYTTSVDTRQRRLRTAGRIIDDMQVRLFDPDTGEEIAGTERRGQPGCKGPATALGYWGDQAANAQLFTADGWMLMGDIVEIDDDGYLTVVGRTSDFIIRGGKNISAPAVEEEVGTHPGVAMVAAVAMPDEVFGERVCVYIVPRRNDTVTLDDLRNHLSVRGVSKEWWPEHLIVVDELPRSSGGKVAKGELRNDVRRRLGLPD